MKPAFFILILLFTTMANASDWPQELIYKAYSGCMRKGGSGQCDCLVTRLRSKFTYEDMQLTRTKKIALEALKQATQAYNVKCLNADFKKKTLLIKHQLNQKYVDRTSH